MKNIQIIEDTLARWLSAFPSLPKGGRAWLGRNLWWIILILAILGIFGTLAGVGQYLGALARTGHANIYIDPVADLNTSVYLLSFIESVITTVLYFMAIAPLKEGKKRGWNRVFYVQLLGTLFAVIGLVINLVMPGSPLLVIGFLFGFTVGLLLQAFVFYFLFQVRGEFTSRSARAKEAEVVTKKPATTKK